MLVWAAIISASQKLGYLLPAIIGLESMGVPSPGETALVTAAVLASTGRLNIWLVILIAAASAIIGDNIGYLLGRRVGRDVLEAPGPFQRRRVKALAVGDRFFDKYGGKAVFLGRWIALVRIATAWLAGINEMPYLRFFCWNALGGISWALAYGLIGYFGGTAAAHVLEKIGVGAAIALGVVVVAGLVYWKLRERRRASADSGERPERDQGVRVEGDDAPRAP
jgi:membrane protein DedA with SNARE-associated domain